VVITVLIQITVFIINGNSRVLRYRSTLADNTGVVHKICSRPDHLTFPVHIDFHFFGLISGCRSAYPVIRTSSLFKVLSF